MRYRAIVSIFADPVILGYVGFGGVIWNKLKKYMEYLDSATTAQLSL